MSGLSPAARGIVERGCRADGPALSDRARNRRAVLARIGATGAVAAGATSAGTRAGAAAGAPGASGTAWGAGSLVAKALVGAGLAAVVSAGAVHARSASLTPAAVAPSPPAALTITPGRVSPEVSGQVIGAEAAAQQTGATTGIEIVAADAVASPSAARMRPALPPVSAHASTAAPRAEAPPSTLTEETALLRSANDALVAGKPARAIEALDAYAQRFPRGLLAEEQAGLRVAALCESGDENLGRRAADGFLRAHPLSALAGRVRQACRGE